jgi:hypothetical protein
MKDSVVSLVFSSAETVKTTIAGYGVLKIDSLREALAECRKRGFKEKSAVILAQIEKLSGGSSEKGLGI